MTAYEYRISTDEQFGCDELPCVDVGVGIYHHPYCGMKRDEVEPPSSPEDEEMLPSDIRNEE